MNPRLWNQVRSLATRSKSTPHAPIAVQEQLSSMENQILNEYMIPGKFLRYFKANKNLKRTLKVNSNTTDASNTLAANNVGLDHVYKKSARSINMDENDSAPTVAQQKLAQRIHRGLLNMFSIEPLPTRWVTPSYVSIHTVKVSRNLRRCKILYEPATKKKDEKGHVHRALQTHANRLEQLIRAHAGLQRPVSIKFVSDTQTSELDDIYKKISAEQKEEE